MLLVVISFLARPNSGPSNESKPAPDGHPLLTYRNMWCCAGRREFPFKLPAPRNVTIFLGKLATDGMVGGIYSGTPGAVTLMPTGIANAGHR